MEQTDFERNNDKESPEYGEISVDYDEFVHKISAIREQSPTKQAQASSPTSPQVSCLMHFLFRYVGGILFSKIVRTMCSLLGKLQCGTENGLRDRGRDRGHHHQRQWVKRPNLL